MLSRRTLFSFSGIALLTVLLTGCPSHESIAKINSDPARYKNRDVVVVGRVSDSYGILGKGAFEVDDGTGKIWVVSEKGLPARGSKVGVQGRVQAGISIGGRNFGLAMYEDKRKTEHF